MKIITRGVPPSPVIKGIHGYCGTVFEFYECEANSALVENLRLVKYEIKCQVCSKLVGTYAPFRKKKNDTQTPEI